MHLTVHCAPAPVVFSSEKNTTFKFLLTTCLTVWYQQYLEMFLCFEFKNIGVKNSLRCLSNTQIISLFTFFVPIWQVYLGTLELHFPAARIQLVSDLARHICKVSNKMILY